MRAASALRQMRERRNIGAAAPLTGAMRKRRANTASTSGKRACKDGHALFPAVCGKGNARGQTWLASCYLYGIGTKEDREEARKWLEKAAAQRDEAAIKLLKEDMGIEYKGPFDT